MYISQVTCSDPREDTPVDKLIAFMKEFPEVEIAIQASESKMGPGKPRRAWFDELLRAVRNYPLRLNLAMHVNMEYCRHMCQGFVHDDLVPWFFAWRPDDKAPVIKRWQINYIGSKCLLSERGIDELLYKYSTGREFIIQHDSSPIANKFLSRLQRLARLENPNAFSVLYDGSAGTGKLPAQWNAPYMNYKTGYSGGLGPENISAQLDKISAVVDCNKIIWIDAESSLKTPGTKTFDIARAREYVLAARQWGKQH